MAQTTLSERSKYRVHTSLTRIRYSNRVRGKTKESSGEQADRN